MAKKNEPKKEYVLAQGIAAIIDKDGAPLTLEHCPFTADALTPEVFETYWNRGDIVCRGDFQGEDA